MKLDRAKYLLNPKQSGVAIKRKPQLHWQYVAHNLLMSLVSGGCVIGWIFEKLDLQVHAGKDLEMMKIDEAVNLLERAYEEVTNFEVNTDNPGFNDSQTTALAMTKQVSLFNHIDSDAFSMSISV